MCSRELLIRWLRSVNGDKAVRLQIVRLSDCQIGWLSDCQIVRLADCQIARLADWQGQVGRKKSNRVEKGNIQLLFFRQANVDTVMTYPIIRIVGWPKEWIIRELGDNNLFKDKEALSDTFMNRRRSGFCNLDCTRPAVFCGHLYFAAPVFIDRRDSNAAATTYRSGGTSTTGWHRYVH